MPLLDDSSTSELSLLSTGVVLLLEPSSAVVVVSALGPVLVSARVPPSPLLLPSAPDVDAALVPSPEAVVSSPPHANVAVASAVELTSHRVEGNRPIDRMVGMLTRSTGTGHAALQRATRIGVAEHDTQRATCRARADFHVVPTLGPGTACALRGVTMRNASMFTLALALVLPACADDGDVDADSSKGWRAMGSAIEGSQEEWSTNVDADGNLDLDAACTGDGTARFVGSYADEGSFDMSAEFDGCTAEGVVISGNLALTGSVVTEGDSTTVTLSYEGDLTWSGEAQGSCAIDVEAAMTTSFSGEGEDAELDFDMTFEGTICGYDAESVANASAELG